MQGPIAFLVACPKMFLCSAKPKGQTFLYMNVSLYEKLKFLIFNHFCVVLIKRLVENSI